MIIIKNKFHLSIPHHLIISFTEHSSISLIKKQERKKKINSPQEFKKEVTKKGGSIPMPAE